MTDLFFFAEENKLIIATTLIHNPLPPPPPPQQKRYWTWESPDGETRNQTDFALSNQRGIVANCEVITKADIGSDHRLVRNTLRISKAETKQRSKNLSTSTHSKLKARKKDLKFTLKTYLKKN